VKGDKNFKEDTTVLVLPETDGHTLCVEFTGLIRREDHKRNLSGNLAKIIEKYGWYNLLISHAPSFRGWETDAAELSLRSIMEYAKYGRRRAFVNPPEKLIMMQKMSGLFGGETRYFDAGQFQDAIAWVKGEENDGLA